MTRSKPEFGDSCYHAIFLPDQKLPRPENWKQVLLWVPVVTTVFAIVLFLTMFDKVIDNWGTDDIRGRKR